MKKIIKALLSMTMAIAMILGVMSPTILKADPNRKTNLHITKLKSTSYPKEALNHDGRKMELSDLSDQSKLGTAVEGLDGVKFTYWKVEEQQLETMKKAPDSYDTAEEVKRLIGTGDNGTVTEATKNGGQIDISLKDGYYWFIETEKSNDVSTELAVPFGISLPITNPEGIGKDGNTSPTTKAGTVIMTDVYVYPKNVQDKLPEVDKTVDTEDGKHRTYSIGADVIWYFQGTVPKNIYDYTKYTFEDTLSDKLTFVSVEEVKYGDQKIGTQYYTVTPPENNGGVLKVELKTEGTGKDTRIKYFKDNKAGKHEEPGDKKIIVKIKTKINEKAVMGEDIKNDVKLVFNNTPKDNTDKNVNVPEQNQPRVVTGGKKFKKVINGTDNGLADAVFELYDDVTHLPWTNELIEANLDAIKSGKFATDINGAKTSDTNRPQQGQKIYLLSSDDGTFEFKGLELSDFTNKKWDSVQKQIVNDKKVTHNYLLKEVKSPEGYAKIESNIEFKITETSYNQVDQDAKIANKKLTIPQTGGIGTLIFTVVGISIMGIAVIAIRKRNREEQ